jgi:hypothetical protein
VWHYASSGSNGKTSLEGFPFSCRRYAGDGSGESKNVWESVRRGAISTLTTYIVEDYLQPSLERYSNNGKTTIPSYATCTKSSGSYSCTISSFLAYMIGTFTSRSNVKAMPAFDSFFDMTSSSPDYSIIEEDTTKL